MGAQANEALATAAAELGGVLVRTSTSVIGKRGSESIIVATAGWGYTVTVVVSGLRVAFTLRPRGWLRRSLAFEGSPIELAREIVDAAHLERVAALAPILVELGPTALRLEHKYGAPADVAAAIDLAASLAQRARRVDAHATRAQLAG